MRFLVGSDNRGGSVSVKVGKPDPREENYNVDPSRRYAKIARTLSQSAGAGAGAGQMTVTLETSSEFVGYQKATLDCAGLTFTSNATITLPQDASQGTGVVQESISMGFRVEQPGKARLTATVESDMDIAEIKLSGPAFDNPIRIFDDYDKTLDLKPGEYTLKGAYQLAVKLPNSSLGGRPLTVEMQATLKPV